LAGKEGHFSVPFLLFRAKVRGRRWPRRSASIIAANLLPAKDAFKDFGCYEMFLAINVTFCSSRNRKSLGSEGGDRITRNTQEEIHAGISQLSEVETSMPRKSNRERSRKQNLQLANDRKDKLRRRGALSFANRPVEGFVNSTIHSPSSFLTRPHVVKVKAYDSEGTVFPAKRLSPAAPKAPRIAQTSSYQTSPMYGLPLSSFPPNMCNYMKNL